MSRYFVVQSKRNSHLSHLSLLLLWRDSILLPLERISWPKGHKGGRVSPCPYMEPTLCAATFALLEGVEESFMFLSTEMFLKAQLVGKGKETTLLREASLYIFCLQFADPPSLLKGYFNKTHVQ